MQHNNEENLTVKSFIKKKVKECLERFDAKENPISIESIKTVLDNCLSDPTITKALGFIEMGVLFSFVLGLSDKEAILQKILPSEFLLGRASDEVYYVLKHPILVLGKTDSNSLRYQFIKKLFKLPSHADVEASQYVDCFIEQVGIKNANIRAPHIDKIIKKIRALSTDDFVALFDAMSGSSSFTYIREAVQNKEISVFDAVLELFEVNGIPFLLSFCHTTATDEAVLAWEYASIVGNASAGVRVDDRIDSIKSKINAKQDYEQVLFAAEIKGQRELVIADIVQTMRASEDSKLYHEIKNNIDNKLPVAGAAQFNIYLRQIQREREEARKQTNQEEPLGIWSVFASTVKEALSSATRTPIRSASMNHLAIRIEKKEIAIPDALHEFLTSVFGQEGPHSLKYALLRKLFGCSEDVSKAKSQTYIKSYIRLLDEVIKKPHDMVLDEMEIKKNEVSPL